MIQLRRRLFSASSVSSSTLRFRLFIHEIQCRGIHRNPESCLPRSPFVISDEYRKSPVTRLKEMSYECVNIGSNLCSPSFGGFSTRFYSRAQTVAIEPGYESLHSEEKGVSGKKKQRAKKSLKQKGDVCSSLHDSELDMNENISLAEPVAEKKNRKGKSARKEILKPLYPPIGKSVVVVESVTKAKVIKGYLGDMYEVLPSYGHMRDLAARRGSVRPDDDFSMVWEVPSAAWTRLESIKVALRGAQNLILASDPDQEGEAIAWHIIELLRQQDDFHEGFTIARVVFDEITESSIKKALMKPRVIDENLVNAYLARRALDYLIGFNISPLLWKKLPGCQTAGRVQSAALALLCDRELEIEKFKSQEYWTVEVELEKKIMGLDGSPASFPANLTQYDSTGLNQLSITCHTEAKEIKDKINSENLKVVGCKTHRVQKYPPTPYITSILQQDAAMLLNFSSTYTMEVAQKLYEGVQLSDGEATGLITYMKTDVQHISDEALEAIRSLITERYGHDFAVKGLKKHSKKVKVAQKAREAIRPTDISRLPSMLKGILDEDSLKLYTLIWCRTVACQMEPGISKQIQIDVGNGSKSTIFQSSCSTTEFLGFQEAYKDVEAKAIRYDQNDVYNPKDVSAVLSSLANGEGLSLREVSLKQHHTQPPPRYSEASLVSKMEELGIGRPSSYAATLKVLQDRNYVTTESRILHPEFRSRMVSAFLNHHFTDVTDYGVTAKMEAELDNVSAGLTDWKSLVKNYWSRFSAYCDSLNSVQISQVEKMLETKFDDFLFASLPHKDRTCPICFEGTLVFQVSRFGASYFIGCDQHPTCKYIAKTLYGNEEEPNEDEEEYVSNPKARINMDEPKLIGVYPGSDEKIFLIKGPYGLYLQLGDKKNCMPKRAPVPHIKDPDSITVEVATELMRYPVVMGYHPVDEQPVLLKLAKTGYVVSHRQTSAPIPKTVEPKDVDLEKALEYLSGKNVIVAGRKKKAPKLDAFDAM